MGKYHSSSFGNKYLALLLTLIISISFLSTVAQTYNPSLHTVTNKAIGIAQSTPTDARQFFYDATIPIYRWYQSTAEVLSYLNLPKYRTGNFIIVVDSGGTLQPNGTYLNGHATFYMFKDSTGDANLVKLNLFGVGGVVSFNGRIGAVVPLSGDYTFSQIGSTPTTLAGYGITDGVSLTGTQTLTNKTISGLSNTLTNIQNSSLINNSIGLSLGTSGTDINVAVTPAALGSSLFLNIPTAGTGTRGALSAANWNYFNNKIDSVHVSNDSIYDFKGGVGTFRGFIATSGGGINQLTGDGTAGPGGGSQAFTLATVNSNVGSFGNATNVPSFAVNAKGLITSASNVSIQIAESQVTNLVTDLAGKLSGAGNLPPLFTTSVSGTTLNFSLNTTSANTAFGNFTGSTGPPSFSKIPIAALGNSSANTLIGFDGSGNPVNVVAGTNITIAGGTISSTGGSGITQIFGKAPVIILGTDTVTVDTTAGSTHLATQGYVGRQGFITLTSLSASSPLSYNNTTGAFSIQVANTSQNGYLSSTDWNTFNGKQAAISLTTTGTSGAATFISNTLNIPQYQGALTLTTTGTSGAATLIGNTLNIPQYSGGGGGVSSFSFTNGNGFTGTVTNPTTTPTLSLAPSFTGIANSNGSALSALSGTGYLLQSTTSTSFVSGSATNLLGYNASGSGSAIVLGSNLSMTGNTLSATGGVPALNAGHIFVGNTSNVATDTVFVNDLISFSQYKAYQSAQGIKANDTVAGYPAPAIDSLTFYYTLSGSATFPEQLGGWLSHHATGDSVQLQTPIGVCIGNSIIAGHPWRSSGLEAGNLSIPDTFGQISWRLTQLTHFQWRNMGWGGQTSAQIRNRFLRDAIGLSAPNQYGSFSKTLSHKSSFVVIEGDVNDAQQHVPVDSTEANMLWMASMCQEYQIPCIFLNSVGDGGATTGNNLTEVRYISILNKWMASGVLNQYGAIFVDINSLWNDPTYGNDNIHFSTFVNAGDKIHFTQNGYDSVAKLIFRVAKLPVLTKMVVMTAQSPTTPLTNYARPTSVSITGYPNGSTPTPNSIVSLPNAAFDTVNITSPIPDTAYFTVLTSATVAGAGTQSGFGPIQFYLDNNPTNQIWYTQKASFAGARSGDLQANSLTIYAPTTNVTTPIIIRRNDGNIGFQINTGFSTNASLNNNGATIPFVGPSGTPTFSIGGGISSLTSANSQFGPTAIGTSPSSLSVGFSNAIAPPTSIGFGMIGTTAPYGIFFRYDGGYNNVRGWVWDNQLQNFVTNTGSGGHSYVHEVVYNVGNFTQTSDTMVYFMMDPTINQTLLTASNLIKGYAFEPNPTSLGGVGLVGFKSTYGNETFNTSGVNGGQAAFGTGSPVASAKLDVTDTARGFIMPRMTATQIGNIGSISAVSMTSGSWSAIPTGITFTGGTGSGTRLSLSISGSNLTFGVVDGGHSWGTTTPPTLSFTGGTGSGGTITVTLAGPDEGLMVYNTTTHTPQWWNGSSWNNFGGGGGAVSSVSNSDGTLTISPTTGAVVASLALGHANTWAALQTFGTLTTTGVTKFTGLTSGAATDSIMTWNPSTGQVNVIAQLADTINGANAITVVANSANNHTLKWGGTLNSNTSVLQAGFSTTFSGGQFILGAAAGTTNWNPGGAIGASIVSVQSGTLNDNVTAASGTVTNAYVFGMSTPTLTATNTGITTTNAYTLYVNAAPAAGANETITNSYALGVNGPAIFGSQLLAASMAFDNWQTVTSGTSGTINNVQTNYLVNPASLLASFTITLPAAPDEGQLVKIHFGGTITSGSVVTTLTISPNSGQSIIQPTAPTTAVAGNCFVYEYNKSLSIWYREQ